MAKDITDIKWLNEPEEHDYPAALSYLRLLYEDNLANAYVEKLRQAPDITIQGKRYLSRLGIVLAGNQQFARGKRSKENRIRKGAFPASASPGFNSKQTHHCRWISSAMCGL